MFSTVSIIPGIENFAPLRTETRSGLFGSPRRRCALVSTLLRAVAIWAFNPGGNFPAFENALHATVVIVNPGGTGRRKRVISARPAPFPPRRPRIFAFPSLKRYTYLGVAPTRTRAKMGAIFNDSAGRRARPRHRWALCVTGREFSSGGPRTGRGRESRTSGRSPRLDGRRARRGPRSA